MLGAESESVLLEFISILCVIEIDSMHMFADLIHSHSPVNRRIRSKGVSPPLIRRVHEAKKATLS